MYIRDKNFLATKQRKFSVGVLGILVGVLGILVGVLGILVGVIDVFDIGMLYLLHFLSGMVYE